jgi:hypothetical protein
MREGMGGAWGGEGRGGVQASEWLRLLSTVVGDRQGASHHHKNISAVAAAVAAAAAAAADN